MSFNSWYIFFKIRFISFSEEGLLFLLVIIEVIWKNKIFLKILSKCNQMTQSWPIWYIELVKFNLHKQNLSFLIKCKSTSFYLCYQYPSVNWKKIKNMKNRIFFLVFAQKALWFPILNLPQSIFDNVWFYSSLKLSEMLKYNTLYDVYLCLYLFWESFIICCSTM